MHFPLLRVDNDVETEGDLHSPELFPPERRNRKKERPVKEGRRTRGHTHHCVGDSQIFFTDVFYDTNLT